MFYRNLTGQLRTNHEKRRQTKCKIFYKKQPVVTTKNCFFEHDIINLLHITWGRRRRKPLCAR